MLSASYLAELLAAAGQAARYQARGFRNVSALKGGVEAWQQAGYPMVT